MCYPLAYRFTSSATTWGCQHEDDAIDTFLDYFAMEHTEVKCIQRRLVVNPEYPFLGVNPDAWVICSCHGKSLIEVN